MEMIRLTGRRRTTKRKNVGLVVVKANKPDIPTLGKFLLEAWREAGLSAWGWTGATKEVMMELASEDHLSRTISNPGITIFLAKGGGKIKGFAANRRIDKNAVELAGVIVEERYTGQGVGNALVNAAIRSATRRGYGSMVAKTETFNKRAIGFYEAEGFVRVGTEEEDVGGKKVELAVLRCRLNDAKAWKAKRTANRRTR